MATLGNTTYLDFDLCEEGVSVESNQAEVNIIDLSLTKVASCSRAVVGGRICYTITISNNCGEEIEDVTFRDPLDSNLEYITGSFEIDGVPTAPTSTAGGVIIYTPMTIPIDTTVITFCVRVLGLPIV